MKINLYRQSGLPVNLADRDAFDTAWKAFSDKVMARAGLNMEKAARFHRFGERQLVKHYNKQVDADLPQTPDDWKALMDKYEQCPIMLAVDSNKGTLIGIIMDMYGQG